MKNRSITDLDNGSFDVASAWKKLVNSVVARFSRGNISAQNGHILFPAEQDKQRKRAEKLALKMSRRKRAA